MKSINRLIKFKFDLLSSAVLIVYIFLPMCRMEPSSSTKANITPVKLLQINPNNTLFHTRNNESVFGSKATISRVVPLKHVPKVPPTHFGNISDPKIKFDVYPTSSTQKTPVVTTRFEGLPVPQAHIRTLNKDDTKSKKNSTLFPTSTKASTTTTSTTVAPKASKLKHKDNRLFLTTDSWNYLNSAVTDDDLREIINGLPNELIQNITNVTKHDPIAGQKLLLKSIISELGNLKRSRMLSLDSEIPVNNGIRFSAKQRKPVLNVTPLQQKSDLGKPIKNLIKTVVVNWNVSGLLNNSKNSNTQIGLSSLNGTTEKQSNVKPYRNKTITEFKPSPIFPTTPTLMQVLSVPEGTSIDSTFPPFTLNQSKTERFPVKPTKSTFTNFRPSLFYDEKIMSKVDQDIIRSSKDNSLKTLQSVVLKEAPKSTTTSRKPREPPKEDEYALPAITTTSTTIPEKVDKGYQTILVSTTPGSKVIWYNHNQTPEDTFYPNSDTFLVPPEESSIEMLAELISEFPEQELPSLETKTSFSPSSSEINMKYDVSTKGKAGKKRRPPLHYYSKENSDYGVGNRKGSRASRPNKKKAIKNVSLQQQATTIVDHHHVRDYYDDLDSKNGGSSGKNVYDHNHKGKPYGSVSYNDIKYHEIIPQQHQQTNRKPSPYRVDDTESYGAFNEDGHYRDSYPPAPPSANRHEIARYPYHSYHDDSPRENEHKKEEPVRAYDDEDNGNGQDEESTTETDAAYKKEPSKHRLKENAPGWGSHHGHEHYQGDHYGWKEPSKDFFSKAKDYFKNSDFSASEKWFDITIGLLAFLAFGGYIIMLLYQVFAISRGTSIGTFLGRSVRGAGEMFDTFFAKGPIGQAYLDELETIVKRAMANVKRIWVTNSFAEKSRVMPKVKGEVDAK